MNLPCRFSHLACMTYETSWGSKHFMTKAFLLWEPTHSRPQQTLHLVKGLITNDFYHLFCTAGSPTVIFLRVLCPGCAHIKQLFLLSPNIPVHCLSIFMIFFMNSLKMKWNWLFWTKKMNLKGWEMETFRHLHKYGLPSLVSLWQKLWPICMHITP